MEKKWISTACTLDCWDSCSIRAFVEDGQVKKLVGNPENPVTGHFLCEKGYKHIKMRNGRKRLIKPLIREAGALREASWEEALDLVAEKLLKLRKDYPTSALLYISEFGNSGVVKKADQRFFNAFGGVTMPTGSLCAGAGVEAQRYDFGKCLAHEPTDYLNSRMIIVWGRNPVTTGPHMVPFIKKAQENGARLVTIDPLPSETAAMSDLHLAPKPGSDGLLAMYMIKVLIENNLVDMDYIEKNTIGFHYLKEAVMELDKNQVSEVTGIPYGDIEDLALEYGSTKPAAIVLGFGIQRYSNGGDTVRAIDALGAVTGNIGKSGGGVSYNNSVSQGLIDEDFLKGTGLAKEKRTYDRPLLGDFILTEKNPPVRFIYTARANPVNQGMDIEKILKAFKSVDFKVTLDMYLTDTAAASDVVLPVKHPLEEDNIVMPPANHSYINYCNKVVESPEGVLSELEILNELAMRLDLGSFPLLSPEKWIEIITQPMRGKIDIELLKEKPLKVPGLLDIPWSDSRFFTPSGKFEFYSETAKDEGFFPTAGYRGLETEVSKEFPLYLITPKLRGSLHSQHFALVEGDHVPTVHINSTKANELGMEEGDTVSVSTQMGSIKAILKLDEDILPDRVKIYQGGWTRKGGGINRIIPERYSRMGMHAAYYELVCRVEKE
jgi:anaerobic selenocysteine-containing dehydrogenase